MTSRTRSIRRERGSSLAFSLLFALATIVSLVAAQIAPPFALGRLANRGSDAPAVSSSHDRQTLTTREIRAGELSSLRRSPRSTDRGRSFGSGPSGPPASFVTTSEAVSVLPASLQGSSEPLAWTPWLPPGRARARLMVFLN